MPAMLNLVRLVRLARGRRLIFRFWLVTVSSLNLGMILQSLRRVLTVVKQITFDVIGYSFTAAFQDFETSRRFTIVLLPPIVSKFLMTKTINSTGKILHPCVLWGLFLQIEAKDSNLLKAIGLYRRA